jgi:ubiquinone biosynthesis O-methyltransferase
MSEIPGLDPAVYARWRASEIGAITDRVERQLILELVGNVDGCRVLDVGCGDGELALELTRRGANVTGIDASAAMIDKARERAAQHSVDIAFHVAKAEKLPFPSGHFDVITAITILCFVDDATPVFGEVARVLKPDGQFVIGELGKWSVWAASRRIRAWLGSQLWRMARFRTAGELRTYARRAGLTVEHVRGAIFYPRITLAARLLSRFDLAIGRHTVLGAAFLALSARKTGNRA